MNISTQDHVRAELTMLGNMQCICNRTALLKQYKQQKNTILRNMILPFDDKEIVVAIYSAELDNRKFESDNPFFQEGEHKAELYDLFKDDLFSIQAEMAAFAVAALYHRWERTIKWMICKRNPESRNIVQKADFDGLKKLLKDILKINSLPDECKATFVNLNVGRLIANVIKHGEGVSAEKLRKIDPEIFERPWDSEHFDLPSDHGVNLIWVRRRQVEEVEKAIGQFWITLPDDLFAPPLPDGLEASS